MRAGYSFRIILKHFKIYHYFVKRKQPTKIIFLKLFFLGKHLFFSLDCVIKKVFIPHDGEARYFLIIHILNPRVGKFTHVLELSQNYARIGRGDNVFHSPPYNGAPILLGTQQGRSVKPRGIG